MTDAELGTLVDQYRAGIEAELSLLTQLDEIAARQRDVTVARNFEAFSSEADTRDELMRALVQIEEDLREVRKRLIENRRAAAEVPGFAEVVELHRTAAGMVGRILAIDRESFQALADADLARRAALAGLERGETTLAAYRKVLAPPVSGAALVDRRG